MKGREMVANDYQGVRKLSFGKLLSSIQPKIFFKDNV